jgi:hypothetical protein
MKRKNKTLLQNVETGSSSSQSKTEIVSTHVQVLKQNHLISNAFLQELRTESLMYEKGSR